MTQQMPVKTGLRKSPDDSSLALAKSLLARSRFLGRVSAFLFILAAVAVIDGLQTLVRHEFNSIDLLAGESVLVSGMMPAGAKTHDDLVVEMDGPPGLTFKALETYKGFWMGGHMWRAELSAAPDMASGPVILTIVDIVKADVSDSQTKDERDRTLLFGGMQNPALVHTVTVYATEADRQAADNSLLRRLTGIQPFAVAALCVLLALLTGIANWLSFLRAEKGLALHDIYFGHAVKDMRVAVKQALPGQKLPAASGYKVSFSRLGRPMIVGDGARLLDRDWNERERGAIVEVDRLKGHALFPEDGVRPGHGWLVTLETTKSK